MRRAVWAFTLLCLCIYPIRSNRAGKSHPAPEPHIQTRAPTEFPTISYYYFSELFPVPNQNPTRPPTVKPTSFPSTTKLSSLPSLIPSQRPSFQPTSIPTPSPSAKPSPNPSIASLSPSSIPSSTSVSGIPSKPSPVPSKKPVAQPTMPPKTFEPTAFPTAHATPSAAFNLLDHLNSPKFIYTSSALVGLLVICALVYRNTNREFIKLFCVRFMTIGFRSINYKQRRAIIPLASIVTTSDTFAQPDSALSSPNNRSNRYSTRTSPSHRRTYPISSAFDMAPIQAEPSPTARVAILDAQPYDTARDTLTNEDLDWNTFTNTSERLRANRRIPRGIPVDAVTLPTPRDHADDDLDSQISASPPARRSRAFMQWNPRSPGNRFSRSIHVDATAISGVTPTYV